MSVNHKLFQLLFTLALFVIIPILLVIANSSQDSQDIRSKAKKTSKIPGKVVYLPFSFTKEKEETKLDFKEIAQVRNGFVPSSQVSGKHKFKAVLVNEKGSQVASQDFSPPSLVAIDSFDKNLGKIKPELRQVKSSNNGLVIPYHPNAAFMQIFNPDGEIVETITLKNKKEINNIIDVKEIDYEDLSEYIKKLPIKFDKEQDRRMNFDKFFPKILAAGGTFNIAIIGDNYASNNTRFQNDVNDIAAGLLTVEPFKTYKDSIVFYPKLSTVQICNPTTSSPSISCDDSKSLQQALDVPYDKVYVLYNGQYAGYAYVGGALSYGSNATDQNLAVKQGLFIHELAGHSLGELMDEYSYGTTGNSYSPNCSEFHSCPSWSNIAGLGCFNTCGYTNLFRATENSSVMNTAYFTGLLAFDKFSTQVVDNKLKNYLALTQSTSQSFLPSPTLTQTSTTQTSTSIPTEIVTPIPTPTFLISPATTLSPTIFATANPTQNDLREFLQLTQVSPTVTSSPIPSPSPSPISTLTPTPTTPPASCTFPNFCTPEKYCEGENRLTASCATSGRVCCKVKLELSGEKEDEKKGSALFEPLPTIFQPQPTNPDIFLPPTRIPTVIPASTPGLTPAPASSSIVNLDTNNIPSISPIPAAILPINQQAAITPIPTPAKIMAEEPPVFPTITPYNVEDILFERPTPTPPPRISILDIITAPGNFINSLFRNIFFKIIGR